MDDYYSKKKVKSKTDADDDDTLPANRKPVEPQTLLV